MKITIDRDELIESTTPVCSVASGKNTIKALDCVLMQTCGDGCLFVGYDLEKGIKVTVPCRVEEEGFFLLNAMRFAQIIKAMPAGNVTVEIDEKTLKTRIYNGKSVFELQAQPGSAYPDLPEISSDKGFSMKQDDLAELIRCTAFSAALNDPRPSLNGVFMKVCGGVFTAVGSDGFRLALCEQKTELTSINDDGEEIDMRFILPLKTTDELMRLLGDGDAVTLRLGRKHILFETERYTMFARLIDVEYIDYERIIPKSSEINVKIDKEQFSDALDRALLVTEDRQPGQAKTPVILNFTDGSLNISAVSITNSVSDDIPLIKKTGPDIEICYNCRYLCDSMKALKSDTVKLSMTSPLSFTLIEPDDEEEDKRFLMIVGPVRHIK